MEWGEKGRAGGGAGGVKAEDGDGMKGGRACWTPQGLGALL